MEVTPPQDREKWGACFEPIFVFVRTVLSIGLNQTVGENFYTNALRAPEVGTIDITDVLVKAEAAGRDQRSFRQTTRTDNWHRGVRGYQGQNRRQSKFYRGAGRGVS